MPQPSKFRTGFIEDTQRDLDKLKTLVEENDWNKVLSTLNTIHLDARENRDYLIRVRDNSNAGF